jgi:MFS superfamily sulfate permease-like transporter
VARLRIAHVAVRTDAPATLAAAPLVLATTITAGWLSGKTGIPSEPAVTPGLPRLIVPSWPEVWRSFEIAVLPQLSLTLTNAVIVMASLARELFPATGAIASERRLALSSGVANVLLCPFGAMPMCHGAGGLAAQFRFGARTGLAPIIFVAALLVLAVAFADHAAALFGLIPIGSVGSLLIVAGADLAISRRLFDGQAVLLMGDRCDGARYPGRQPSPRSGTGLDRRIDPRRDR